MLLTQMKSTGFLVSNTSCFIFEEQLHLNLICALNAFQICTFGFAIRLLNHGPF